MRAKVNCHPTALRYVGRRKECGRGKGGRKGWERRGREGREGGREGREGREGGHRKRGREGREGERERERQMELVTRGGKKTERKRE